MIEDIIFGKNKKRVLKKLKRFDPLFDHLKSKKNLGNPNEKMIIFWRVSVCVNVKKSEVKVGHRVPHALRTKKHRVTSKKYDFV